jgi:hypothetical protein
MDSGMLYSNVYVSAGSNFWVVNPARSSTMCCNMDYLSCILLFLDCNLLTQISMYLILSNSKVKLSYTFFVYLIGIQFLRMFEDVGIF